ncbi:hypothetical protein M3689_06490 [Alkalihalophilus marmarensis]|jgi:hypothetical protein|uniref:hypothetical protein n=1 Tax=Alkalihalophilus marmarensis TaxID=521377 RepID=UPI00203DEB6C|nr:hypothetical protein [Alkalihalophilus marmarensis]MCM3488956.1 hypothetical protein [Alkalihalophilus marmarensis]
MGRLNTYSPRFISNPVDLVAEHKEKLVALTGKTIKSIWIAWDHQSNRWLREMPVVIEAGNEQIELCANRIGEYSITFNTINLEFAPSSMQISWEENKLNEIHRVLNQEIRSTEMIESTVHISCLKEDQLSGKVAVDYVIDGIGFNLERGYLAVCNGLDENIILTSNDFHQTIKCTSIK